MRWEQAGRNAWFLAATSSATPWQEGGLASSAAVCDARRHGAAATQTSRFLQKRNILNSKCCHSNETWGEKVLEWHSEAKRQPRLFDPPPQTCSEAPGCTWFPLALTANQLQAKP